MTSKSDEEMAQAYVNSTGARQMTLAIYNAHLAGQRVGEERVLAILRSEDFILFMAPFFAHDKPLTGTKISNWLQSRLAAEKGE